MAATASRHTPGRLCIAKTEPIKSAANMAHAQCLKAGLLALDCKFGRPSQSRMRSVTTVTFA